MLTCWRLVQTVRTVNSSRIMVRVAARINPVRPGQGKCRNVPLAGQFEEFQTLLQPFVELGGTKNLFSSLVTVNVLSLTLLNCCGLPADDSCFSTFAHLFGCNFSPKHRHRYDTESQVGRVRNGLAILHSAAQCQPRCSDVITNMQAEEQKPGVLTQLLQYNTMYQISR